MSRALEPLDITGTTNGRTPTSTARLPYGKARSEVRGTDALATVQLMPRTDSATRLINAPISLVFEALVDRTALQTWLPPDDMTGHFERFDPTPGGSYRLVLTYADPSESRGKSTSDSDVVEVRFLEVVANDRVVQAVDFESDAPEFAGTMTMTWSVRVEAGGTRVEIVADDVPDGISAEDHAAGLASSLENLAGFVES